MQIKLIDSHFNKDDARSILLELIHAKIHYHKLKSFSHSERGEDFSHSDKRISELSEDLLKLEEMMQSFDNDDIFKINCEIVITR